MFKFVVLFLMTSLVSFTAESFQANADVYGVLTLLPAFVAIILAFMTKNVIISLFIGIFSGSILLNYKEGLFGFVGAFGDILSKVIESLSNPWNAGIILQILTIGGLIALISKMGGTKAVAEEIAKRAKSPVSAQLITWFLGILIFFDDYANSLIVGPIMRPITDKMKISREKLAFLIDATAAPIAGIALISTWVGYEISVIKDGYSLIGHPDINAYEIFIQTVPFRFYNILMLVFVVTSALLMREFGPMLTAERRARLKGKVNDAPVSKIDTDEAKVLEPKEGVKPSIWNAIIPLLVLVVGTIVIFYANGVRHLDGIARENVSVMPFSIETIKETFEAADASVVLFQAAMLASLTAVGMGMMEKIFTFAEALEIWTHGMKGLIPTCMILLLAWSLTIVTKELGTSAYLVSILSETIPKGFLPSLIFIISSAIAFATGTSYGTMGILVPLSVPLANAIGQGVNLSGNNLDSFIVLCIGAVLTGSIFGDHCSPISDTTILSAKGASCDHVAHVRTQLIYALVVGAFALLFGYLPAGFGIPIIYTLPLGVIAIILTIRYVGKPIERIEKKN